MRIFTRYTLKEISSHSVLGLVVFTFVLYFPSLNRLLQLVVRRNLPMSEMLLLFLLPIPGVLVITIPIAILMGALIGLSRMAADGEVIAARAAGVSLGRFARPVMLYAGLGCAAGLVMSMILAPASAWQLIRTENDLRATQLPYEIQPREFLEQLPGHLLYLRDVNSSGARWKGVFIADTAHPSNPEITLARSGYIAVDRGGGYTLHLNDGTTHTISDKNPLVYTVVSFMGTDMQIPTDRASAEIPRLRPAPAMTIPQLIGYIRQPRYRRDGLVELNSRLALPFACLALAWAGMPLGLVTRKGGKAVGVLLALLLVFIYYVIMALGMGFAKQGRVDPVLGLWTANILFGVAGLVMAFRMRRVRKGASRLIAWWEKLAPHMEEWKRRHSNLRRMTPRNALLRPRRVGGGALQILDLYIIRHWLFYAAITEVALTGVYIIFDFFQLLNFIARHHIAAGLVLTYYAYLIPDISYLVLPLSVLVATLVSLSLLTKSSQTVAMKAAGVSLYRVALPVALAALAASALMFVAGDRYLPAVNQREEALRNEIQGRPAQTFLRPGWQWIYGKSDRIYNYHFFDSGSDVFANLSLFDFNRSFQMTRRIYANRAFWEPHLRRWVLEDGWVRWLQGNRVTRYQRFSITTFKNIREDPSYFKEGVRTSEQMSVLELYHYIEALRQSGFDVVRLSVQFYRKFSYPLAGLVVTLIGIPFAFTVGRKGALSGIALSLGIAIAFWSVSSLFQAMGNLNQLPPALAAWTPDLIFGFGGSYLLLRIRT
jgi:LPS export ABC transporter permease LptG/LPS export ABC transporter permease LptF